LSNDMPFGWHGTARAVERHQAFVRSRLAGDKLMGLDGLDRLRSLACLPIALWAVFSSTKTYDNELDCLSR
jgi:hypothetical protein